MTDTVEQEREAFDKWFAKNVLYASDKEGMWLAWRARAALQSVTFENGGGIDFIRTDEGPWIGSNPSESPVDPVENYLRGEKGHQFQQHLKTQASESPDDVGLRAVVADVLTRIDAPPSGEGRAVMWKSDVVRLQTALQAREISDTGSSAGTVVSGAVESAAERHSSGASAPTVGNPAQEGDALIPESAPASNYEKLYTPHPEPIVEEFRQEALKLLEKEQARETSRQPDETPQTGDYVLATKYSDGDPGDAWALGFYDGCRGDRHFVKDNDGNQIRHNGYRRVAKISKEYGDWLWANRITLEMSPPGMINLWGMLSMEKATQRESVTPTINAEALFKNICDFVKRWEGKVPGRNDAKSLCIISDFYLCMGAEAKLHMTPLEEQGRKS